MHKDGATVHSSTTQEVSFFDLSRQTAEVRDEVVAALARVCDSGQFVLGPECERLETSLADYCRVPHAVACASGSDALLLALMASGVTSGDEVILPSFTFFATAGAVWRLGARPVFVDIDDESFNIDPAQIEACISSRTRAIIAVHLYGQCADMDAIVEIARRHKLVVIEDAAQAIGAELGGRRAGAMGDIGCFSFYPSKNLGGFGDGGLLTAADDEVANRLRKLRVHGESQRYHHELVGFNSRLDAFQAAVLNVKLPHLETWTAQRRAHAERYAALFAGANLTDVVGLPRELPDRRHVWNQYVVRVSPAERDELRKHLAAEGVGTQVYYPVPLHQQPCFQALLSGPLPETERAAAETLALPVFPEMREDEQRYVVASVARFFNQRSGIPIGEGLRGPKFLKARSTESHRPGGSDARAAA